MGLKKKHEHESGFFEDNVLAESVKNSYKFSEEKMRQIRIGHMSSDQNSAASNLLQDSIRNQNTVSVDNCNNVSSFSGSVTTNQTTNCNMNRCKDACNYDSHDYELANGDEDSKKKRSGRNRHRTKINEIQNTDQLYQQKNRHHSEKYDETYEKLINTLNNYQENGNTIVIDSDDDDEVNWLSNTVTRNNGHNHKKSNSDNIVDIADDDEDDDEDNNGNETVTNDDDDDGDAEIIDVDIDSNQESKHPIISHHTKHNPLSSANDRKTNSNNNKLGEKSKNGEDDAKAANQLMLEIEEASTIRPQGE